MMKQDTITLERYIKVTQSRVFKAWTDAAEIKNWWGPKGFTTTYSQFDPRPGGLIRRCIRSQKGKEYWAKGVIQDITFPKKLVYIGSLSDKHGNTLSAHVQQGLSLDWAIEMLIEVEFEEQQGKTKIKITHSGVSQSVPEQEACVAAWEQTLDSLEDYLARSQ